MKLMLCALLNYNMGGKIRELSMNVAFKYIYKEGWIDQESGASNKHKEHIELVRLD